MKYKDWLYIWLENYVKPNTKQKTFTRYLEIVNNNLKTSVGEYDLYKLTPIELQRFITNLLISGNKRTGEGLSPSTVNSIITVMQGSLKTAYNIGEIDNQISAKIQRPKQREKRVECFSLEEQKKIEQAVLSSTKLKLYGILICLYTGIRIGELLALEWADLRILLKCFTNATEFDIIS